MSRLPRLSPSTNIRLVTVLGLSYLLLLPSPLWIASYHWDSATSKAASLSDSARHRKASARAKSQPSDWGDLHTSATRFLKPSLANQSFGIVLTPVNIAFNGQI